MSKIPGVNSKDLREWVKSRPTVIKELFMRLPPDRLYTYGKIRKRVYIVAYNENGTVTVCISPVFNKAIFAGFLLGEYNVVCVKPDDIVECDLTAAEEADLRKRLCV